MRDDGSGAHDGAVTDSHSWDDRYCGAEPYLATDQDRRRDHVGAPVGINAMVESCQRAAVADERAVPDGDAPGVLEATPDVDEDVLAQGQVLAELAVERRKDGDRFVHRPAGEPCQQVPHFVGCAVPGVELGEDAQGVLPSGMHETVLFRAAFDHRAPVHVIQEVLQVHLAHAATPFTGVARAGLGTSDQRPEEGCGAARPGPRLTLW